MTEVEDDCDGITPLHDAAANGKVDVVRLLVTRGANVHAKDDNVSLNGILIENSGYELLQSEMPNFPQLATKFDTKSPSEKIADQSAEKQLTIGWHLLTPKLKHSQHYFRIKP